MDYQLSLKEIKKEWHGTITSYTLGFFSSLILTCLSFFLVATEYLTGKTLVYTIVALALVQAMCQLRFFLHLGQEAKPRWESLIFWFMVLILLIIVLGSLWIMNDLNDRMMVNMKGMAHD